MQEILEVPIPEWAGKRPIHIFAGREHIGVLCEGKLWLKTTRCNYCGKCCTLPKDDPWAVEGTSVGWTGPVYVCKYLKKERWHFEPFNGQIVYYCTNPNAPFGCCSGPSPVCGGPEFKKNNPDCILEYKEYRG